ncbi:phosphatase PAP2 family protein [Variovorax sp. GT1P44]|uniref:phosphatase PAP2 family protein n=1 Tax=Variovorax sp. GT1P44 TaxID=3443742 RepID=UPI003F45CA81
MIPGDRELFLLLNADADAPGWLLGGGHFLAVHAHWLLVLVMSGLALHRWRPLLRPVLAALVAIALGSLVCEAIGQVWDRPRPFETGLGYVHLGHSGGPSFPSSHATAYAALAVSFLLVADYRVVGWFLVVLAGLVSLSRVVVGVHYPLDISVGAAIGGLAAVAAYGLVDRVWKRPAS